MSAEKPKAKPKAARPAAPKRPARKRRGLMRSARIFSALTLVAVLGLGWLMISPRLPTGPSQPPASSRPLPQPPGPSAALPPDGQSRPATPHGLERLPDWLRRNLPGSQTPTPTPIPTPTPVPLPQITSPVDRILIEKAARRMTVWQADGPAKTYRIALGRTPDGAKTRQGDGRTPEGVFRVDRLNDRSKFHLSLGLDYPQKSHREAARRAGVDPGGDIMIHGQPNQIARGYRVKGDWTEGCIAVDDHEIEELFAHTKIGTKVEIRP